MFTGLPAMMQNLPILKHGGITGAPLGCAEYFSFRA
jgi:hypothetical protein